MSTQLADIVTKAKTVLLTVYTEMVPDKTPLPYAVVTILGAKPDYTVGDAYIQEVSFRISIWTMTLAQAESLAQQMDFAFNRQSISSTNFGTNRENYVIPPVTVADQRVTYGAVLEYTGFWTRVFLSANSVSAWQSTES